MKTINSTLSLSIVTLFMLFVFSGCYTQLAYVADEPDSVISVPSNIDYQPQTTIVVYEPIYIPTPPVYDPLPTPGYSPIVNEPAAPAPTRDSGYRRSDSSEDRQTADSVLARAAIVEEAINKSGCSPPTHDVHLLIPWKF